MSDIVERLRALEAVESELACECDCPPEATANYRYAMTCAEAADRIEQLEAALRFYADESLEGYDFSVIDYGLSVELGEIIKDGGAKARAALGEERT